MRVLYDMTPSLVSSAGVARYVVDLGIALSRQSDIELIRTQAPVNPGGGRLKRAASGVSRRLVYYPYLLGRRAEEGRFDLIHCPGPHVPRALEQPMVLTIHDLLPWRYPEYFSRQAVVRNRVLIGRGAQRATRIIVGSQHTRSEVIEVLGVEPRRVSVTRFGLDLRFQPAQSTPMWLARRFGIPGRFVLCSGTREPHKNLVSAIKAFEQFQLDHPEYTLVVVGDRPIPGSATEAALNDSTARIVRAGFVGDEELVRLYSSAAAFVFPSVYEGFGFPPIEAMACGAPVICSDRASLPEIVGDAALLADPTNVDLLTDAMARVLTSPQLASDLRERGLAHARTFTWARCATETAEVYREAVADPR